MIKSFTTQTYRVDGVPYRYTWDQTINYHECTAKPRNVNDVDTYNLNIGRNYIIFQDQDGQQIIRFAMANKISPLSSKS